jgi:protein involved in polysaccharide export with SLBB domain
MRFVIHKRGSAALLLMSAVAIAAQAQDSTRAALPAPPVVDTTARPTGALRQGDILNLKVYRDSELSGKFLIDARGDVQIPGLGTIRAAGLTPTEISDRLVDAMRSRGFRDPELAIQPEIRVSVLGQVRLPELYSVDPGVSLIQLLTLAGGPTDVADLRHTRVIRDGREFIIDLQSALSGSPAGRVGLYSNDVVYIPKKGGLTKENVTFIVTIASASLSLLTTILLLSGYR